MTTMASNSQIDDCIIHKILTNYIKHRNYKGANSESILNEFTPRSHGSRDDNVLPAKDWFLEGALSAFQSMRNVTSLRASEEDFVKEVDVAYRKFVEFAFKFHMIRNETPGSSQNRAEKTPLRVGEELHFICFPLFVHIFIQLFECGYVSNAKKFFTDHYQKFVKKSNQLQFLNSMQTSLNNNCLNQALQNFKNYKCRILITEESFNLLSKFLTQESNLSILQIFNSSLDFRVMSQDEYTSQQVFQEKFNPDSVEYEQDFMQQNRSNPNNSSVMNELLSSIDYVQNLFYCDVNNERATASQTLVCLYEMLSEKVSSVAVSKNLTKIVGGTEDSEIILWDFDLVDNLQYYSARVYKHWKRIPVRRVPSSVDFKFIDNNEIENGVGEKEEENSVSESVQPIVFRGHSKAVYDLSFVPDSSVLLSASGDTTIRAWDSNSGSCLGLYQGHSNSIWTIDSNKSGCFLSGSRDGTAFMWDIERTIPLRIYCGHLLDINQIKFHPNSNYLATASADKNIILWDINQVRQVRMFCGHTAQVNTILFSSCGKYLASASSDCSVRLWDISQGRCIAEMLEHRDDIRNITFSAKENLLASCGSNEPVVNIWDRPIFNSRTNQNISSVNVAVPGDGRLDLLKVHFIKENLLLAIGKRSSVPGTASCT